MPNLPEYCFLLSGASLAGVPCTTINPTYKPGELAKYCMQTFQKIIKTNCQFFFISFVLPCRQLDLSGAKAVATLQSFLPQVEQALKKLCR